MYYIIHQSGYWGRMLLKVSRSVLVKLAMFNYTSYLTNILMHYQRPLIALPGCILLFLRIGVTFSAVNKKIKIFF